MSTDNLKTLDVWRGGFGDDYVVRNTAPQLETARILGWSRVFASMHGDLPKSCVEIGANIGQQLQAIKAIADMSEVYAVEPNASARQALVSEGVAAEANVVDSDASSVPLDSGIAELSFTCGVLIHVHPSVLDDALRELFRLSSKYVLIAEYYAPHAEEKKYRGEDGLLFKNDFGGRFMDLHPSVKLVDYGFFWKRVTGLDDLTWWLFEKQPEKTNA